MSGTSIVVYTVVLISGPLGNVGEENEVPPTDQPEEEEESMEVTPSAPAQQDTDDQEKTQVSQSDAWSGEWGFSVTNSHAWFLFLLMDGTVLCRSLDSDRQCLILN